MDSPPLLSSTVSCYRYNCSSLGAYAKPTTVRYSTQALSVSSITIVKQLGRVELHNLECNKYESRNTSFNGMQSQCQASTVDQHNSFTPPLTLGSFAGHGVVTVKRTVHGYKKLSLVNRVEVRYDCTSSITYNAKLLHATINFYHTM
jgi:hypothetical protein